jgi:hypothetical protein
MRNLVALAALLAFLPVANAADNKSEFSANAEYRLRYQNDSLFTGTKDPNFHFTNWRQRGKADFGYRSGEKFAAHMTLIHNALWGNLAANSSNTSTPDGVGSAAGGPDATNMVLVNQFYGSWMINDSWSAKFGRGGFTMADGALISQNDWETTPNAFEGLLVNWEHEMFRLGLFMVRGLDSEPAAEANFPGGFVSGTDNDPEINFYGVSFDWKALPEALKVANVHLLKIQGDEYTAPNAIPKMDLMRFGLAVGGDIINIDYKADLEMVSGSRTTGANKSKEASSMMQFQVGYTLPEAMKSRFYLGWHSDTGNKEDQTVAEAKIGKYDGFFYEKHGSAGLMDVLAWGNLSFIRAGYTMSPMDQVEVGIHYWKFQATAADENDAINPTYGRNGFGFNAAAADDSDSKNLGQEIDLSASKKYDGGFMISAHYGMFMPGTYFKDDTNEVNKTYSQFFVEGKMTF